MAGNFSKILDALPLGADNNTTFCIRLPVFIATTDGSCTASAMHVASIVLSNVSAGRGNKYGQANVAIVDDCGSSVAGATVGGTFSGDFNEASSGSTDSSGIAAMQTTTTQKGKVSFTFCVDDISGAGLAYDSSGNAEDCDAL